MKKYILLTLFALSSMQMNCPVSGAMEIEENLGEGSGHLSMPIEEKKDEIKEFFEGQKKVFPDLINLSKKFNFTSFYSHSLKEYPEESNESIVAHFIKCGVEKIISSGNFDYYEHKENYDIVEKLAFHPSVQKYFNSKDHKVDPNSKRAEFFRKLIKVSKVNFKKNSSKHRFPRKK